LTGKHRRTPFIRNYQRKILPVRLRSSVPLHRKRLTFDKFRTRGVATWRSPALLVHGDDDRNVPFQQTTDLLEKLRARRRRERRNYDIFSVIVKADAHPKTTARSHVPSR